MPKYYLIEKWIDLGPNPLLPNSEKEAVTLHGFDDLEKLIKEYKSGSKKYKGEYIPVRFLEGSEDWR